MINFTEFEKDCVAIRRQSPLVLSLTNYVAMNLSANSLLAIGASPLMSFYAAEMEDLSHLCSSALINIGCLDDKQIEAMRLAAGYFSELGKPWVLDPVGAGASKIRTQISQELISMRPSVIRGNAAEIAAINGTCIDSRGVDSCFDSSKVIEIAKELSLKTGSIVSMSGPIDYITDGYTIETVEYGSDFMPKVTAMGCTAGAITAAFTAVNANTLQAATHAMLLMGLCGEKAAKKCKGTGSFGVEFIDQLSQIANN